ncbi:hypothetical protein CDD82_6879 [Ophiocordyceps australis]|uniref:Uncharacterized protein n=1 Tax=Ophiocordyceps australis TaxID=1399860 RepID=A0A2C5YV05_9HYPO|nr:hypothetical protein CDD82_6879 [Ophiocordyceps australis]
MQTYYFVCPPHSSPQRANTLRAFNTARRLVDEALQLDDQPPQLLVHAPHWVLRSLVDGAAIIITMLHSSSAPDLCDAHALARRACAAVLRCSVRHADLAHRLSLTMDTFWSNRHLMPPISAAPAAWPDRLAASVTFWCLETFRVGLRAAQGSSEAVAKTLDVIYNTRPAAPAPAPAPATTATAVTSATCTSPTMPRQACAGALQQEGPVSAHAATLDDIDWIMFMDDFG